MVEVSPEIRAKVKKLAREYMRLPLGKNNQAAEAGALMREAGLSEEEAVGLWYEISTEILEDAVTRLAGGPRQRMH